MSKALKIIATDDHKVLTNGIYDLLQQLMPEAIFIGSASSPEGLKQLLRSQDADILILDYRLGGPVSETHDLVRWIIKNQPELKIIMYSSDDISNGFHQEFPQAVQAYVLKNDEPEELIHAIRAVASGKTYRSHSIKSPNQKQSSVKNLDEVEKARLLVSRLTTREKEVLIQVAKGLKNKEIALLLFLAEDTIKVHRKNLNKKLQAKNVLELQKIALLAGLLGESD